MISTQINTQTFKNFYSWKLIAIYLLSLLYSFLLAPCSINKVYANENDLIVVLVIIYGLRKSSFDSYRITAVGDNTALGELWNINENMVIDEIMNEGAISIWPSYTYAANASIVTGVWPKKHGVTGNQWFDRSDSTRRMYDAGGEWLHQILKSYGYGKDELNLYLLKKGVEEIPPYNILIEITPHIGFGLASIDLQVPTIYDLMKKNEDRGWKIAHHMYGLCETEINDDCSLGVRTRTDSRRYLGATLDEYLMWYVVPWEKFLKFEDPKILGEIDIVMMDKLVDNLTPFSESSDASDIFPHLITLYFINPDHLCHVAGNDVVGDTQRFYMKEIVDPQLDRLVSLFKNIPYGQGNVYEKCVFIFTADHGHTVVKNDDQYAIGFKSTGAIESGKVELDKVIYQTDIPGQEATRYSDVYDYSAYLYDPEKNFDTFIGLNGGMAHIYLRNHNHGWRSVPTKKEVARVVEWIDKARDPELTEYGVPVILYNEDSGIDRISAILVKDFWCGEDEIGYMEYKWLKSFDHSSDPFQPENAMELIPIDSQSSIWREEMNNPTSIWHDYIKPETRIKGVNHPKRSGDIILISNTADGNYFDVRLEKMTHGSMLESDSIVPFVICGVPVQRGQVQLNDNIPLDPENPAWIVDIAPTIITLLGLNVQGSYDFDGDSRVIVNLE